MFATRVHTRRCSFATARSIAKLKPPLCSAESKLSIGVKIPFSTKCGEWVIYVEPVTYFASWGVNILYFLLWLGHEALCWCNFEDDIVGLKVVISNNIKYHRCLIAALFLLRFMSIYQHSPNNYYSSTRTQSCSCMHKCLYKIYSWLDQTY